jgi:heme/copper-type cytochrome/quinol oxidase subunit 2
MKHIITRLLLRISPLSATLLSVLVSLVLMRAAGGQGVPSVSTTTAAGLMGLIICRIAFYMFWTLTFLTVVMVLVAAYQYLTSQGDPQKVGNATKTITWAAVAVIVALIAAVFPIIIGDIFGVDLGGGYYCTTVFG